MSRIEPSAEQWHDIEGPVFSLKGCNEVARGGAKRHPGKIISKKLTL